MPPKPTTSLPRPRLTHFLCIPLVTPTSRPQLQNALNTFKQDVTRGPSEEYPDRVAIPEKAIRPLGTLHLTLGVMSLEAEEKAQGALQLLRELDLKLLLAGVDEKKNDIGDDVSTERQDSREQAKKEDLKIILKGLTSMHSPFQTSILYTSPVDSSSRLLNFCQRLKDIFVTAEFMVAETRPLLLHATIMNTIYVPGVRGKDAGRGHGKKKAKLTIDAKEVLGRYENFEWMTDVKVEKVAICRMGAKKGDDGEERYVVEGEIDMP